MIVEFVLVNLELQLHCQKKLVVGMYLYDDSTESRQNYKFQKLTAKKDRSYGTNFITTSSIVEQIA